MPEQDPPVTGRPPQERAPTPKWSAQPAPATLVYVHVICKHGRPAASSTHQVAHFGPFCVEPLNTLHFAIEEAEKAVQPMMLMHYKIKCCALAFDCGRWRKQFCLKQIEADYTALSCLIPWATKDDIPSAIFKIQCNMQQDWSIGTAIIPSGQDCLS